MFQRVLIAFLISLGSGVAFASDAPTYLQNDKEAVSRVYSPRDLKRAKIRVGSVSEGAWGVFSAWVTGAIRSGDDLKSHAELLDSLKPFGFQDPALALADLVILWRSEDRLDDVFVQILRAGGAGTARYLKILKTVKNRYRPNPASDSDRGPNEFSSRRKYRRKGSVTNRMDLYQRFSGFQVLMLSDVLRHLFERMDAIRAQLVFVYPDRQDAIDLSPMGQYYFARRLLLKEMQDLNRSALFAGVPFGFEEVITAALETGLVNGSMLSQVFSIDDLWNPQVTPWQKVTSLALRLTGSSSVFLPPPFNVLASLAVLVVSGIVENRRRPMTQGRAGYDPF